MNNDNNKRKESESSIVPARNKRLKTLVKPKRVKRITETVNELEQLQKDVETITKTELLQEKDYYECTACAEKLFAPYPPKLKRLIKGVRQNEVNYRKEQEENHRKIVEECKKNGQPAPIFTFIKGGLSKNDQAIICRMHKVELVLKPLGIEKGYPTNIAFEEIGNRIKEMKIDLENIINGKNESQFLKKVLAVHEELGAEKARRTTELINRFDEYLPGYYGHRGSHHIMESLQEMFINTEILDKEKANPLTQIEFAQQVLVPEVGSRLIMQDMKLKSLEEAVKTMEESTEYGSVVYNKIKKVKE